MIYIYDVAKETYSEDIQITTPEVGILLTTTKTSGASEIFIDIDEGISRKESQEGGFRTSGIAVMALGVTGIFGSSYLAAEAHAKDNGFAFAFSEIALATSFFTAFTGFQIYKMGDFTNRQLERLRGFKKSKPEANTESLPQN